MNVQEEKKDVPGSTRLFNIYISRDFHGSYRNTYYDEGQNLNLSRAKSFTL